MNEVVDFVIDHGIAGVQGNYDETVANDREHCGCKYEDPVQAEMAELGFAWTKKQASSKSREYMRNLPPEISFAVDGKKVIIFHATPKRNNLYWYEDRPEMFLREMAEKVDAEVLICSHTHKPYRKDIGGKVFINARSVGKPKNGYTRGCVTLVEIAGEEVKTEFSRVACNVENTAVAIMNSGLPPYFAEKLREGKQEDIRLSPLLVEGNPTI